MSHPSNIVYCTGPGDPHALDGISRRHRSGDLDTLCPVCLGYGQWNTQIDLVSQRSIRHACPKCDGRGWIETGDDLVPSHDIERSAEGRPDRAARPVRRPRVSGGRARSYFAHRRPKTSFL